MSTNKHIDRICCIVIALVVVLSILFCNAEKFGVQTVTATNFAYENKIFDTSKVHTMDIIIDDWDGFLEECENEEYETCAVVIDDEAFKNVAIRAKGNTSLSQVKNYGNNRYSFKVEFDHYDSSNTYYGLDKLCLNNIIQDNTLMKDYLTYQMMNSFGADAPLCSYVYITVNGEDWGLYLAVEAVEDSFLERNYGGKTGELYKPDSQSMGGGRGNGRDFDMDKIDGDSQSDDRNASMQSRDRMDQAAAQSGAGMQFGGRMDRTAAQSGAGMQFGGGKMGGGPGGGSMGNDDVCLIYSDDDFDSYSSIFENAKTDVSDSDKKRLISSIKQLNENENIEKIVNIEEVIRYFVVHNFVVNFDSYTGSMIHNYYLYEEDGQMSMIPWDYNLAFGGFIGGTDASSAVNYPIDTPVSGGEVDSRPMLAWILNDDTYTQMYHTCFEKFLADYFDSGLLEEMIDTVSAMISPYVESDPTKFCTYDEFETGVETLKQFCLLRAESVRGQLDGTIPSTSDGQSDDNSSLVDASSISIADMGSMNNGGGMGGGPDVGMQTGSPNGGMQTGSPNGEMQTGDPDGGMQTGSPNDGMHAGDQYDGFQKQDEVQVPDGAEAGSGSSFQIGGDMAPPDRMQMGNGIDAPNEIQQSGSVSAAAMLGISLAVLLAGLFMTRFFKDHV